IITFLFSINDCGIALGSVKYISNATEETQRERIFSQVQTVIAKSTKPFLNFRINQYSIGIYIVSVYFRQSKNQAPMKRDQVIFDLIDKEERRQKVGIELIASENFTSKQVMEAAGSVLTNKYAEGLPNRRYYGGCEVVDQIEQLAIDR